MVLRPPITQIKGHIRDDSEGGMSLVVFQPLEPGTILQVRSKKRFVLAEVRYCTPHADSFQVGVEIKDVFELPATERREPW